MFDLLIHFAVKLIFIQQAASFCPWQVSQVALLLEGFEERGIPFGGGVWALGNL